MSIVLYCVPYLINVCVASAKLKSSDLLNTSLYTPRVIERATMHFLKLQTRAARYRRDAIKARALVTTCLLSRLCLIHSCQKKHEDFFIFSLFLGRQSIIPLQHNYNIIRNENINCMLCERNVAVHGYILAWTSPRGRTGPWVSRATCKRAHPGNLQVNGN